MLFPALILLSFAALQSRTLTLPSPAKINLSLMVLSKLPTGYHDLHSVFQAVDMGDRVTIEENEGGRDRIIVEGGTDDVPKDHDNIVLKAIKLYNEVAFSDAEDRKTFDVRLVKRCPSQAGLGGGSGNAATALKIVNEIHGNLLSDGDLKDIADKLGSDCGFFFSGGTAVVEGRGDRFRGISIPGAGGNVRIWKGDYGLSTPLVFKALDLSRRESVGRGLKGEDVEIAFEGCECVDVDRKYYVNDLQSPAFELKPELEDLYNQLRGRYKVCMMSGSGTSVFTIGEDGGEGEIKGAKCYETRFVNRVAGGWY